MTANDKGELIVYINYLRARGEENRREARKNKYAISNWLMGCGNARIQVAEELEKFIEYAEAGCEQEECLIELNGSDAAKHTSKRQQDHIKQTPEKEPHRSGTPRATKPVGKFLKYVRRGELKA